MKHVMQALKKLLKIRNYEGKLFEPGSGACRWESFTHLRHRLPSKESKLKDFRFCVD